MTRGRGPTDRPSAGGHISAIHPAVPDNFAPLTCSRLTNVTPYGDRPR